MGIFKSLNELIPKPENVKHLNEKNIKHKKWNKSKINNVYNSKNNEMKNNVQFMSLQLKKKKSQLY